MPNAMLRVMPSSALACCSRLLRRDLRHEGRRGGHEERRGRGVQRIQRDQVPDARLAAQQEGSRRHLDDGAGDVGREQDRAPRQAVGPDAADQHEHRLRQDAREQHDAERGRRAAEVEHRERQRDREDAVAEDRDRLAPEEERELALAQDPQLCPPTGAQPRAAAGSGRSSPAARARPSRPSTVGARSPSLPPSRRCAPASVTTSGTGFVVCAVCGEPSGSSICSALPWSAVTSATPPAALDRGQDHAERGVGGLDGRDHGRDHAACARPCRGSRS